MAIAADPELIALADHAPPTQPRPNLLLAAIHDLVLAGTTHPLATHYPSVGGTGRGDGIEAEVRDFALDHVDEIVERVTTRRVQTNEVRRSVAWYPAFGLIGGPLAIIEVGASAGLNLLWDRYGYRYGSTLAGDPAADLVLSTATPTGPPPLPSGSPDVVWRRGIDIDPVDLTDAEAVRWLCALLWPEQVERLARLEQAVAVARDARVRVDRGNALDLLEAVATEAPADTTLVVYHSFTLNQATDEERRALEALLGNLGRPVVRFSLEWLDRATGPRLEVSDRDHRRLRRLADVHHHGEWIAWST
jgi:hypothetical protein